MTKSRLGRGLSALIPTESDALVKDEPVTEIKLELIKPNSFQPRKSFDKDKLDELARSIQEHGVVQPVVVRPLGNGEYELVVGERRLRACQQLLLEKIPAVVKDLSDRQMVEIALIENIQREDLNPVEEAAAYKRLMEEFDLTQEEVAQRVAKSRSFVANMLRLLKLPQPVLEMLSSGQLTVGHVRPLLAVDNEEQQIKLAGEMIEKNLTVRDAEALTKKQVAEKPMDGKKNKGKENKLPPGILDLESRLRSLCGTKVRIKQMGEKGRIEIDYYSSDDLDRIVSIFLKEDYL
ncbi:MAG: ParB/RepB/Spo0J family partition protein [Peptococcaceae bacterium]|nr:ParB/RepB/Spo0J family partition protein [Peptococcaceae bacterium]MDH7523815.1 ParB/RepB/Spo0J family partition protein [Peptococcaceae bacterium]